MLRRSKEAQTLGVSVGVLHILVKERFRSDAVDKLPGKPIEYPEIEPWPQAVDGAALLTELTRTIREYVVMSEAQCVTVSLWALFAHAHDLRDYAPMLVVTSPVRRCGKTKLLEVVDRLVPRPLFSGHVTAPFLAREIEERRPTIIFDEYDATLNGDPAQAENLRGQFNNSFKRRTARVGKSVPLPGGGWANRVFSTWAPTAIAGIGKKPDTIEDRAVVIELKRKLASEQTKPLRDRDGRDLFVLRRKIARWVADNAQRLHEINPPPLDVENDRAKDVWEPLLAIADTAGEGWPQLARAAAQELVGGASRKLDGRERVISDCVAVFDERVVSRRRASVMLYER